MRDDERDEMLGKVRSLTRRMRRARERSGNLARERRALLLRLNREGDTSFTMLEDLTGLSRTLLQKQINRAKDEAGVTGEHPRLPAAFAHHHQNGDDE